MRDYISRVEHTEVNKTNKKHCPQGFYILAGGDRQINTTNKYTTVDP